MENKLLIIFDLDDTLIFSEAKIKIHDSSSKRVIGSLTPSEFNHHETKKGQFLSFDDFSCEKILGDAIINHEYFDILLDYIKKGVDTSIVTGRENKQLVINFLRKKRVKIEPSLVYAVCDPLSGFQGSIAQRKKQAVTDIIRKGYNNIVFYDDNMENLLAVKELEDSNVKIKTIHVNAEKKT